MGISGSQGLGKFLKSIKILEINKIRTRVASHYYNLMIARSKVGISYSIILLFI